MKIAVIGVFMRAIRQISERLTCLRWPLKTHSMHKSGGVLPPVYKRQRLLGVKFQTARRHPDKIGKVYAGRKRYSRRAFE